MIKKNIEETYKKNEIETSDQKKLIIMLYDGAIQFLETAKNNMHYTKYDIVNTNITKAQNILMELLVSLDREKGKEIADNLSNLYLFLNKHLLEANLQKDASKIGFVQKILIDLKEAWTQIDTTNLKSNKNLKQNQKSENNSNFVIEG